MIPSFSIVSSSCCSLALRWMLHLRGASIHGLASRFRKRVVLPSKLPMRSNCSGNCFLRSSIEVTFVFYAVPAGTGQLALDLIALIVTTCICSQARNPRMAGPSIFTPLTFLVATNNFQNTATFNFATVVSCQLDIWHSLYFRLPHFSIHLPCDAHRQGVA